MTLNIHNKSSLIHVSLKNLTSFQFSKLYNLKKRIIIFGIAFNK